MKKLMLKWIENITTLLCLTIIGIVFVSLLQSMKDPDRILTVMGYRPGVVISRSMEPTIKPGDMIISEIVKPKDVNVRDIITYRVNGAIPITHRVIGILEKNGQIMFETKGDANGSKDGEDIFSNRLVGRMVLKIPRVGYAVQFLKSKLGFTLVISIPITVLWIAVLASILYKSHKRKKAR